MINLTPDCVGKRYVDGHGDVLRMVAYDASGENPYHYRFVNERNGCNHTYTAQGVHNINYQNDPYDLTVEIAGKETKATEPPQPKPWDALRKPLPAKAPIGDGAFEINGHPISLAFKPSGVEMSVGSGFKWSANSLDLLAELCQELAAQLRAEK